MGKGIEPSSDDSTHDHWQYLGVIALFSRVKARTKANFERLWYSHQLHSMFCNICMIKPDAHPTRSVSCG